MKPKKLINLLWGFLLGNAFCFAILLMSSDIMMNDSSKSYQTSELRIEERSMKKQNLLMVGVMTAPQYFNTRASAVYHTWGRQIPGDIKFYSSQGSRSDLLPLIALPGVDDSYPPQKKSLMMLKHMHDNYLDQYEWFMRADDDVYVRADRLEQLLRSVDSTKIWFIGQTGRGNSEEFGLLSLDTDENFCMGGPGVILSRETLKRVAPYVDDCLKHLYTAHEDVELGRCVRRFAGVSCTWSYQMQVIFYHNQSGSAAFTGDLKQKEIHQAITLHPVKHSEHLYRLHNYFKGLKIRERKHDSLILQRDLLSSTRMLGENPSPGIPASIMKNPTDSLDNVHTWEFFANSLYSSSDLNPRRRLGTSLKEGISDVVNEVMELINQLSKQRGRLIQFKEILYGYWRYNPIYGIEYILDLLLVYRKYRGHKMTIQVRRHAYLQQTFTAPYVKEVPPSREESKIENAFVNFHKNLKPLFDFDDGNEATVNFILPLSGRYETFERFMRIYENVCLKTNEMVTLTVVYYENEDSQNAQVARLLQKIRNNYYYAKINLLRRQEKFSRAKALQNGINTLDNKDLLFFIDVDMVFSAKTLERIRLNTIPKRTIYFPIVYSLYRLPAKAVDKYEIDDTSGFWRQFGFGIVSLYKSDYQAIGGLNLLITGWGFEDVTFYDKAVKSDLRIVRAADPSLIHVYHPIRCDADLDVTQRNMCLGTEASVLGPIEWLQKLYEDNKGMIFGNDQIR